MTQVLVVFDPDTQTVDFARDANGYISLGAGLETAALYSVGSRRRARPSDNQANPYGWWGDNFPEVAGDEFGCFLWVVKAEGKLTTQGIRKATLAAEGGFKWMLEDNVASGLTLEVEREDPSTLDIAVRLTRPDGGVFTDLWKVHEDGI